MGSLTEVSEEDFEQQVLQSAKPVLVDFWAPWCIPCRMVAPIMEELAKTNGDSIAVVKINVDNCSNLAASYGVSAIPTILLFKGGEVVDRFVGVQPKNRLQGAIDEALA
jgi:thioredoxin 1